MFARPLCLIGSLFALVGVELHAATVSGQVDLGDPPRQRRRSRAAYANAEAESAGEPAARIGAVYLLGDNLPPLNPAPPVAVLEQRNLQFYPHVLPIQLGTEVYFPNFDQIYHNVFSYSSAKSFDLGRYLAGSEAPSRVFDEPGEVDVFCEVHEHMRSTILVVESPIFAPTDAEGHFELSEVPPGDYELVLWKNPGDFETFSITVPDDVESVSLDLRADD